VQAEIAPISDARGTAEYKRMLLRQLILAHFQPYLSENELFGILSEAAGNTRPANS
jgi:xanthine dehydrogenase small subunit